MNRNSIIWLTLLLASTSAQSFDAYATKFHKTYANDTERAYRQQLYLQKWTYINETNSQNLGYTLGENQFTDRTPQQTQKMTGTRKMSMQQISPNLQRNYKPLQKLTEMTTLPLQLDWRTQGQGKVTPVKNQGWCGSCWAFAATALYQSYLLIGGMSLPLDLSEEYILECTTDFNPDYPSDCDSGYMDVSVQLAVTTGIPTEELFPYQASQTTTGKPSTQGICQTTSLVKDAALNWSYIGTHWELTSDDVKTLVSIAPVGVFIYANKAFISYSSGVFKGCPSYYTSVKNINHAVLLIGYDSNGNYIIKNQWGPEWGDKGFITISKDADCGISYHPVQIGQQTESDTPMMGNLNEWVCWCASAGLFMLMIVAF